MSEVKHPSNDCPEHDIINEIGQDIHKIELVDDLLSIAPSNSFEEVGNENNVLKTSEIIVEFVVNHPQIQEVFKRHITNDHTVLHYQLTCTLPA